MESMFLLLHDSCCLCCISQLYCTLAALDLVEWHLSMLRSPLHLYLAGGYSVRLESSGNHGLQQLGNAEISLFLFVYLKAKMQGLRTSRRGCSTWGLVELQPYRCCMVARNNCGETNPRWLHFALLPPDSYNWWVCCENRILWTYTNNKYV